VTTTAEPTGPRPDREPDLEHRLAGWAGAARDGVLLVASAPVVTSRGFRARQAVATVDHRRRAIGLAVTVAVGAAAAVLALGLG
jgi:hypothetical protein